MWHWDQGRLDYFQFDNLKKISRFAVNGDLKNASREDLASETGLPFLPADDAYRPWRNYSRVFKLSLICADTHDSSISTDIASLLALDGDITTDEYKFIGPNARQFTQVGNAVPPVLAATLATQLASAYF